MKKFWKATLIPGLFCIFAGLILSAILLLGFHKELVEHTDEFSINEDNFFDSYDSEIDDEVLSDSTEEPDEEDIEENDDLEPLDDDESFAHILDIDSMDAPDVLDMDDDYIVDFDDIDGLDSSIDSIDDEFGDQ